MSFFSYHLVKLSFSSALKMMIKAGKIEGLIHAETMSAMVLGSPIFSKSKFFNNENAVFAQWENEDSLDKFLERDPKGKSLAKGWHLKLDFLRKWGKISYFKIPQNTELSDKWRTGSRRRTCENEVFPNSTVSSLWQTRGKAS